MGLRRWHRLPAWSAVRLMQPECAYERGDPALQQQCLIEIIT
jgi:hypothetical protein